MRTEKIGQYATIQSISEIGLGSAIHSLHIPLGGHFLSLNQGFLLTLAQKSETSRVAGATTVCGIASAASLLKGLSPAGKRVTPMIAIAVQGLLYSAGIILGGANIFGALLGMTGLVLWGIVQPLLLAGLFFGKPFFNAVVQLWLEIAGKIGLNPERGLWFLGLLVGLKILAGAILVGLAWSSDSALEGRYLGWVESLRRRFVSPRSAPKLPAWKGAVRDLFNPLFLVSFLFSTGFVTWTQMRGTGDVSLIWMYGARVLVVSYLFFLCLRAFPMGRLQPLLNRFTVLRTVFDRVFAAVEPRR